MIQRIFYTIISCFCLWSSATLYAQDAEVIIDQPEAINQLIAFKKDITTVDTYVIQIYQSDSPMKAKDVKATFLKTYEEWPASIKFFTPYYKIWVGRFADRLEADRARLKLKEDYPDAFIIQPKK